MTDSRGHKLLSFLRISKAEWAPYFFERNPEHDKECSNFAFGQSRHLKAQLSLWGEVKGFCSTYSERKLTFWSRIIYQELIKKSSLEERDEAFWQFLYAINFISDYHYSFCRYFNFFRKFTLEFISIQFYVRNRLVRYSCTVR